MITPQYCCLHHVPGYEFIKRFSQDDDDELNHQFPGRAINQVKFIINCGSPTPSQSETCGLSIAV